MSVHPLLSLYGDYALSDRDGSLGRLAVTLANEVFREIRIPFEFIFLKSARRDSRQALIDGCGVVIIDTGQAAVLATGTRLMRLPSASAVDGLAFGNLLLADGFARHGQLARALVCAAAFPLRGDLIGACHERSLANGDLYAASAFLICHELAHFAIDAGHPLTSPYVEAAREALEKHCLRNLEFAANLAGGVDLPPDVESSVTREPAEARALMAAQIAEHVAAVRNDGEVVREACCDFLSVVALLSWRSGVSLAEVGMGPMAKLDVREAGDTVMLGHGSSRMLMVHEFARLTAKHISLDESPEVIGKDFARMTARHSVTTNMYLGLFEAVSVGCAQGDTVTGVRSDEAPKALRQAIERLNGRSADLFFSGIEEIGLLHRDRSDFERAYAEAFKSPMPSDDDGWLALDLAVARYVARFPF